MLNVKKFLNLTPFHELKVVSGHNGLENIISSVNIMDNPDALDWFSVGELLLTSGYFFKDSVELQNNIMLKLKTLNCPALCIKPHRYLGTIPENMIQLSNELDLPIIELPYGLSFSKITSRIMQELAEKYDSLNKQSLDIHTQFFNISLHGGGLQQISVTLAHLCESAVLLLDPDWALLHWTDIPDHPYPLREYLSLEKNEVPFPKGYIESFPPEFEKLQKPIVRLLDVGLNERKIHCTVLPVFFQAKHFGFVVLWEPLRKVDEYGYIALENGAMAFSLERIRSDEVERARNRIRRDFLEELLLGNITAKDTLHSFADLHNINLNLHYTAIIFPVQFTIDHAEEDLVRKHQSENAVVKQLLKLFDQMANRSPLAEIVFSRKNRIIVLVGTSPERSGNLKETMIQLAETKIHAAQEHFPEVALSAGIGNTVYPINQIHNSFHLAQETLRMANTHSVFKGRQIFHYNEYMIENFLIENVPRLELIKLFQQTLGAVHEYDQKNNAALLETLDALITNRFNIAEASRLLFIHRNTLLYRIEKIQAILAIDLKDAEDLLKVQLGLKVYHLLNLADGAEARI